MYSSLKKISSALAVMAYLTVPSYAQQQANTPTESTTPNSPPKAIRVIRIENDGKVSVDNDVLKGNSALISSLSCHKPSKPFLGISVGNGAQQGVTVVAVTPESAADKAGLQQGDIIITIDGKELHSPQEVTEMIQSKKVGDNISVLFSRDGKPNTVSAVLGEKQTNIRMITRRFSGDEKDLQREKSAELAMVEDVNTSTWTDNDGTSVEITTSAEKDGSVKKNVIILKNKMHGDMAKELENLRIELPDNIKGLVDKEIRMVKIIRTKTANPCEELQELKSNPLLGVYIAGNFRHNVFVESTMKSMGAEAVGLQRGDIITSIEGTPVKNYNELRKEITKHAPGDRVAVTYKRDAEEKTVYVLLSSQAETKPELVKDLEMQCVENPLPKSGVEQSTTQDIDNSISVYPNPTHGLSTIRFTSSGTEQLAVSVTDMEGREVMTMNHPASIGAVEIPLDVTELSSGMYMVSISQNGQTYTERIIVE